MVAVVNLTWIQAARAAFAAVYGEKKGLAVCNAVIPGVMGDFRKMLERAAPGETVRETYRLDDKKGDIALTGRREEAGLLLTSLTLQIPSIHLPGSSSLYLTRSNHSRAFMSVMDRRPSLPGTKSLVDQAVGAKCIISAHTGWSALVTGRKSPVDRVVSANSKSQS